MVVIAVMPAAGLMISLGKLVGMCANDIAVITTIGSVMENIGWAIINNLNLLFAIAIGGSWAKERAGGAFAACIAFILINNITGQIFGVTDAMLADPNAFTHTLFGQTMAVDGYFVSVLGAPALNMGVFIGMISGFTGAIIYNKYYNYRKLPDALAFFNGKRFVPLVVIVWSVIIALILSIVWPFIQLGINSFGVWIATSSETSPVLAVNTDANAVRGSVGRLLPGLQYKLKKVEGINEGGSLCVKGNNVMLGYMRPSNKGVLETPSVEIGGDILEGWYDTGDIVEVDKYGFIYIKGRAKRFAKLGGEMVSLVAIEMALSELWPDVPLGIVAIPDSKKGEQLVLIIEKQNVTTNDIATYFATKGVSALWTPKKIICVKQAPLLGSGKFDYNKAKEMAKAL